MARRTPGVRSQKTLYNRWKRRSEKGVFARILVGLATQEPEEKTTRPP
jgi:hypothetical protein